MNARDLYYNKDDIMGKGSMDILVAQTNPIRGVGDIAANTQRAAKLWVEADEKNVDLIVLPEQYLTGYPLEDLAKQPDMLACSKAALDRLVEFSKDRQAGVLVGYPEYDQGEIYNTVCLIEKGRIIGKVRKHDLPNDDVFDEKRIYTSSDDIRPVEFRGHKLGILICEDLWHPEVAGRLAEQGAEVLISPNASPWHIGKESYRIDKVLRERIAETNLPVLYVNQVGGMDELVFDGHSIALNADGSIAYQAKGFEESFDIVQLDLGKEGASFPQQNVAPVYKDEAIIWQALVLGTRDYIRKNGFKKVHLGNSGGIDSAVVAALAVDAIGAENVNLYRLPSKYTEDDSNDDAEETAKLLGASSDEINIWPAYEVALQSLQGHMQDRNDATTGNLQARIRGLFLMALSNRNDSLLLSTGNKSEMTVGYATLYGDMNGGFNPLKDVDKLLVRRLAEWRNQNYPENVLGPKGQAMSQNTISKLPKAELDPDNKPDEAVLAPYPILTDINRRYIEQNQSIVQIAQETGYDDFYIEDTIKRTDWSEHKRRQSCPGLKITPRSFGKGYRVPITRPNTIEMINSIRQLKLEM